MAQTHTIDATGKSLGRVASEVAFLLQGKRSVTYAPNVVSQDRVEVKNLSQVRFTGLKKERTVSYRYSGYPGGIKSDTLGKRWDKNPVRVFEDVVLHMLPKNKLQKGMMKHLTIHL